MIEQVKSYQDQRCNRNYLYTGGLDTSSKNFLQAATIDLVRAYLYQAELAVRTNNFDLARSSFAQAKLLDLNKEEKVATEDEFAHIEELLQ